MLKTTLKQLRKQLYHRETPTQMFSCEICENFKNTYFKENLETTASVST